MTPESMRFMRFEIEKSAAPLSQLAARAGRALSKSPARTAVMGAGVGAAHGAATADTSRGESRLGKALGGAVKGGIVGGAVGGAGRAYRDTRLLNPGMSGGKAVGATVKRMGGGIKRFGQRQWHGLTGAHAKDPGKIGLRSTATAEKKKTLARLRHADELKHVKTPGARKKLDAKLQQRPVSYTHLTLPTICSV